MNSKGINVERLLKHIKSDRLDRNKIQAYSEAIKGDIEMLRSRLATLRLIVLIADLNTEIDRLGSER